MTTFPDDDTRLRRAAFARALTEAGYPISAATLATMAVRGGGPPYELYGRIPIYVWGDGLAWARARTSKPACTTAEHHMRASAV